MIRRIRHRGLRDLHESGSTRGVDPRHAARLQRMLTVLDSAASVAELSVQAYGLHALTGRLAGYYAMRVSGNWQLTFRFEGEHITDVNYVDYH